MATSDEAAQRRRERILARAVEDDPPGPDTPSSGPSSYQRYQLLKQRDQQQHLLLQASKATGLVVVLLSHLWAPEAVFAGVVTFMVALAVRISLKYPSKEDKLPLPQRLGLVETLWNKAHHFALAILAGKVLLNTFASYLLAAVLVNLMAKSLATLSPEL